MATAASTAFPPSRSTRTPAREAWASTELTTPCRPETEREPPVNLNAAAESEAGLEGGAIRAAVVVAAGVTAGAAADGLGFTGGAIVAPHWQPPSAILASTPKARGPNILAEHSKNGRYIPVMAGAPVAQPLALGAAVLTVSDTRTPETDSSGACAADRLTAAGHVVLSRRIVSDDILAIRSALRTYIGDPGCQVVVITGGTGITSRDVTPEAVDALITKHVPGFGELFRMLSFAEIGAASMQSRALAGVCDKTLVFALPGSTAAVRLAMDQIILPQLDSRTMPCNFAVLLPRL